MHSQKATVLPLASTRTLGCHLACRPAHREGNSATNLRTCRGKPAAPAVLMLVIPGQNSRGAASSIFLVQSALSWLPGKLRNLNFIFACV